jgi:phosphoglycolate phosphatase
MIPPQVLTGIQLLIFDLDGTLVDSEVDLAESVNAARAGAGQEPLPVSVIASYVGQGVNVLMRRALGEEAPETEVEQAVARFLSYYRDHMLDHTAPYPGVREALDALRGRTLAVLTNKPVRFSEHLLAGLGLAELFVAVYGGNSFAQKKPDPVGVYKLLEETGAPPRSTLIVGDSDTDILTGQNAGVWTCGVTYGLGSPTLENVQPDMLLDDLRELPRLLDGAAGKAPS